MTPTFKLAFDGQYPVPITFVSSTGELVKFKTVPKDPVEPVRFGHTKKSTWDKLPKWQTNLPETFFKFEPILSE